MVAPKRIRSTMPDPFLTYRFLVLHDGEPVAACTKVTALTRKTDHIEIQSAGDPQSVRYIPKQTTYEPITLERGLVLDKWFEDWVKLVWFYDSDAKGHLVSLGDFRRDLTLQLMNQAGQLVAQYVIFNCWPSSYTALPDLEATANMVAVEKIELRNEGWQRDDTVEPEDPVTVEDHPGVKPKPEVPEAGKPEDAKAG